MGIKNPAKRQTLANTYASDITHFGLATGAPGTSPANGNELTGAGPEGTYARVAVSNSAGTGGVRNWANGTLHLPATGTAYEATVLLLCSAATGATVVDWEYLDDPIPVGPQGGVGTLSGVSYTQS